MNKFAGLLITLIFLLIVVIFAVNIPQESDSKTEITVSAASSLTECFTEMEKEFEKANPEINVQLNLASSGSLRMQIEGLAPIDVFASASKKHMDLLEQQGLIDNDSRRDFAENSLVMIIPTSSENSIMSPEDLINEAIKKVAIGDPETAPVGRYAKEALEVANLWDNISDKIVYAESVKQVLVYVENGEVEAGFVYMTDAMSADMDKIQVVAEIPVSTPISYPIAVIASSTEKEAAGNFVDFVLSDEGKAILKKHGFIVVDEN
ncbi:molybdate ABC transporter substrate-binding protein [Methanohalophilus sp.]|uniref:molybdate ABC transporter substrate-binding protein n=1 Tax=Methanohalophilus sp. TaxID=1966352 RepID=UPI0026041564|nr:molybdate ABC transporter substrate-binding protein [Methanohalophilus sp.]MDK2892658.1 molybdate transport system substrate-binding protein [Methanohalophilus sp.]